MLKDINHVLDENVVSQLVNEGVNDSQVNFYLVAEYDGALLDNYLFVNESYKDGKGVTIGRKHKVRKYIIVSENYLNETLSKTNNRKYNYEIVSSELNKYIFFEGVDFEKYNF